MPRISFPCPSLSSTVDTRIGNLAGTKLFCYTYSSNEFFAKLVPMVYYILFFCFQLTIQVCIQTSGNRKLLNVLSIDTVLKCYFFWYVCVCVFMCYDCTYSFVNCMTRTQNREKKRNPHSNIILQVKPCR